MNGLVIFILFSLQYLIISINSYNCSNAYQRTLNANKRKYNELIYLT